MSVLFAVERPSIRHWPGMPERVRLITARTRGKDKTAKTGMAIVAPWIADVFDTAYTPNPADRRKPPRLTPPVARVLVRHSPAPCSGPEFRQKPPLSLNRSMRQARKDMARCS